MDDGRVAEFDSPAVLLRNPESMFFKLVTADQQAGQILESQSFDKLEKRDNPIVSEMNRTTLVADGGGIASAAAAPKENISNDKNVLVAP